MNPNPLSKSNRYHPLRRIVVALVLGVCVTTGFGVYQIFGDRRLSAESHQYLASIQLAQDKFYRLHGHYAAALNQLDLERPEPTFFAVGEFSPGHTGSLSTSWSLTLTRFGDALVSRRGTVTFNEHGFDRDRSTL